jgi:uncharacterized protein (UPF0332 family)
MSLERLFEQDKLKTHKTSKKEISNLLRVVSRDLKDARVKGLSVDRKFATAYNAALQTATILLYCRGYKPRGVGHHFTVFQAMKDIMGKGYYDLADYFDACRAKRNLTDYDYAGAISRTEAQELFKETEKFLHIVLDWLKQYYPKYLENM